jgi:hypothetical protein
MSNPTAEDTTTPALRDADRVVARDRNVTFVWDLGADPEGGIYQAALSVHHHKYERGGAFSATVQNQTHEGNTIRMKDILTGRTRILDRRVARYSKKDLEAFADEALATLREKYGTDDEEGWALAGYFAAKAPDTADEHEDDITF